ncbi:ABC transporter permease [Sporosarcina sp. Sa2YVA2]|uniref:ABC transporter permease n=1 Tax=Sporosarcina quadrami TaxID=2762234 RepID=A0ABR8UDB0_9BACL|nr:ABC transporter permease [Sporosarcina quadrami]MBD7986030.1 ABC transporter permease [Sporosarcina quadrami]
MKSFLIARKDVQIMLKDKKAFLMMILMPIVLTAILGTALKGMMGESKMPETIVGIYTVESSVLVDTVIESLSEEDLAITMKQAESDKQLQEWIARKDVHVGVRVPKNWGNDATRNRATVVPISGQESAATIIQQLFEAFAQSANIIASSTEKVMEQAIAVSMQGNPVQMDAMQTELGETMQAVIVEQQDYVTEKSIGDETVSAMQYYAAAMGAMFLLFNAMHGGKTFHRERQTETMARVLMTPSSPWSFLAGKFMGTFFFAFLQFTVFLIATHFLLQVNWGSNSLQVFFIVFFYCIAVAGLSMIVAAFTTDEKMADVVGSLGVQVLALLGGSMLPLTLFPAALRKIAMLTPNSWALDSFTSIMSGTDWSALWMPATVLLGIGILSILLSMVKFRRQVL